MTRLWCCDFSDSPLLWVWVSVDSVSSDSGWVAAVFQALTRWPVQRLVAGILINPLESSCVPSS